MSTIFGQNMSPNTTKLQEGSQEVPSGFEHSPLQRACSVPPPNWWEGVKLGWPLVPHDSVIDDAS